MKPYRAGEELHCPRVILKVLLSVCSAIALLPSGYVTVPFPSSLSFANCPSIFFPSGNISVPCPFREQEGKHPIVRATSVERYDARQDIARRTNFVIDRQQQFIVRALQVRPYMDISYRAVWSLCVMIERGQPR